MNSTFKLANPYLNINDDHLYHFGVRPSDNLSKTFGDVKFVCVGGKSSRMKNFAQDIYKRLGEPPNSVKDENNCLHDIAANAGRYAMFKVGEVLIVSHGVGMASLIIVLNEVFKLLHYAECQKDVEFIRIGSSGGLGVEPGTVVVTNQPYTAAFEEDFKHVCLGEELSFPCPTSHEMRKKLKEYGKVLQIPVVEGNTLSANDFFEGQGRVDGAFCNYNESDKQNFLKRSHDVFGIKNMEMESTCLAAMCARANFKCAIVCTTLVNRLLGDVVKLTAEQCEEWEGRLFKLVGEYIKAELAK